MSFIELESLESKIRTKLWHFLKVGKVRREKVGYRKTNNEVAIRKLSKAQKADWKTPKKQRGATSNSTLTGPETKGHSYKNDESFTCVET